MKLPKDQMRIPEKIIFGFTRSISGSTKGFTRGRSRSSARTATSDLPLGKDDIIWTSGLLELAILTKSPPPAPPSASLCLVVRLVLEIDPTSEPVITGLPLVPRVVGFRRLLFPRSGIFRISILVSCVCFLTSGFFYFYFFNH
jgi:hypothetical protein